ncbi:MAG: hypothetical protein ACK5MT_05020 [Actinomycetales bacterium]
MVPVLAGVAGLLVLILVIVAGVLLTRGPGIETATGPLADPADGLDSYQQQWTDGLASMEVSAPQARCYYAVQRDAQMSDSIACGPVRWQGAADDAVWDVYAFTRMPDDGTISPPAARPQRSQALASESFLFADGSGREQDVDPSSAEPLEFPQAAADGVWDDAHFDVDPANVGEPIALPGNIQLNGLGVSVIVESVRPVSAATIVDGSEVMRRPADGQVFYLLRMGQAPPPNELSGPNEAGIEVNGAGTPIGLGSGLEYLFSAPENSGLLTLTSDGNKQTVEIFTGTRLSNPQAEQLYLKAWPGKADRDVTINYPNVTGPDGNLYDLTMKITGIETTVYDSGWAPEGQVFASITLDGDAASTKTGATYTMTCTATVTNGTFGSCPGNLLSYATVNVSAPSDAPVQLGVTPTLHINRDGSEFDVGFPSRNGTVTLP